MIVLTAPIQPGPELPSSPVSLVMEASFLRPMLFRSVKVKLVFPMRPPKATIWSQPAGKTCEKATGRFGMS